MSCIGRFSMYEIIADALKGLADYPKLQAILSILTIFGLGAFIFRKGERDRRTTVSNNNGGIPTWMMIGPIADAIQLLRSMEEEARNRRVEERERHNEWVRETRAQTDLLEDIRNLLELRSDSTTAHPTRIRR
jgi:hypothetical protein